MYHAFLRMLHQVMQKALTDGYKISIAPEYTVNPEQYFDIGTSVSFSSAKNRAIAIIATALFHIVFVDVSVAESVAAKICEKYNLTYTGFSSDFSNGVLQLSSDSTAMDLYNVVMPMTHSMWFEQMLFQQELSDGEFQLELPGLFGLLAYAIVGFPCARTIRIAGEQLQNALVRITSTLEIYSFKSLERLVYLQLKQLTDTAPFELILSSTACLTAYLIAALYDAEDVYIRVTSMPTSIHSQNTIHVEEK